MQTRTAVQVLREMSLIKSQVKDEATRSVLLKPLQDELACYVDAVQRQGELDIVKGGKK